MKVITIRINKAVAAEIGIFYSWTNASPGLQISVPQICRRACKVMSFSRLLRVPRNLPCELMLWVSD
jgi:hypothetical protein